MYNLEEIFEESSNVTRLRKQVDGLQPANLLRSIKVKIISNCNLRCEMCRYWQIAKQQLDDKTVFSLLDHAAELGSKKVHFSGGEVTLHPSLNDFIAHATQLGMRVNLTSNGIAMDKQRAKNWLDAGLRSASFSLDGTNSKTHDKIRGVPGAFKKTLKAIRIVKREILRHKKAKLKIRINTVLSQQNFQQLAGLLELGGNLGVVDVIPMPIDGKKVTRPTVKEIDFFNRKIAPACFRIREHFGMPINAARIFPFGRTTKEMELSTLGEYAHGYYDTQACYAPWLHAFVSHDGNVFACCMTRQRMESLGNVKTQTLKEIFQGVKYEQFRQQMRIKRLPICAHCDQYTKENKLVQARLSANALVPLTGVTAK